MEIYIYIALLFCTFLGYTAARIEFARKTKTIKVKAYWSGFEDGFDDALKDAGEVRRAHEYHSSNRL